MRRNVIILFHKIVDQGEFQEIISFLNKNYTFGTLDEVCNADSNRGICHITFDDAEESFYSKAFPVLNDLKAPSTLFISPKIITERLNFWFQEIETWEEDKLKLAITEWFRQKGISIQSGNLLSWQIMLVLRIEDILGSIALYKKMFSPVLIPCMNMTWEQVNEVKNTGLVAIGAHTQNHPILANESDASPAWEIEKSIKEAEEGINDKIKYFAYPNGIPEDDFGEREKEVLKNSGIEIAVSTEMKFVKRNMSRLAVPRISISGSGNLKLAYRRIKYGEEIERIKGIYQGLRGFESKSRASLREAVWGR